MTVGPEMINGHGIAHGGFIFALADCAASLAANSYNERAVAATTSITFLASCRLGDRLIASASEVVRRQRTGIYDVSVSRGGEVVAEFRATTRATGIAVLAARSRRLKANHPPGWIGVPRDPNLARPCAGPFSFLACTMVLPMTRWKLTCQPAIEPVTSDDGMVSRLGRGSARAGAAEVVCGRLLGSARPTGRHCPLPVDEGGSKAVARSARKAAPCAVRLSSPMFRSTAASGSVR
jgi:phenylacetic acid degradation protein PaaD